jgi:hypothetical protein
MPASMDGSAEEAAGRRGNAGVVPRPQAPEFVSISVVGRANEGGPALLARVPDAEPQSRGIAWLGVRSVDHRGLGARPGVIESILPTAPRVPVNAFVHAGRPMPGLTRTNAPRVGLIPRLSNERCTETSKAVLTYSCKASANSVD